jgi:hypothetical protein
LRILSLLAFALIGVSRHAMAEPTLVGTTIGSLLSRSFSAARGKCVWIGALRPGDAASLTRGGVHKAFAPEIQSALPQSSREGESNMDTLQ